MVPVPLPPTWVALPPEVNTARLMLGAGPAPMLQAAGGWEGLAILLETQADELAASLNNLQGLWSGAASQRAVAATLPMIMWLRTTAMQAQKRAMQATAQANSYSLALATTPPIPEIEQNHVTNAVLNATNFLGINTVPIAVNEFDYFVRMWNQAAGVMTAYQAETSLNLLFEPIMPMKPIVMPGVGEATAAAGVAQAAARAPMGALRNATVEMVSAHAHLQSGKLVGGRAVAQGKHAAEQSGGQVKQADNATQQSQMSQQVMQQGVQMATQVGSQLASLPQQFGQQVSSGIQQITQPLQQVTSMFSQMGAGGDKPVAQMGLIGANPFSSHPMAGGSGPSTGAGLVRAASLPGLGGTTPSTPLLSNLVGNTLPVGAGAPGAGGPGLAPVGAGGGGMGPMGGGHGNKGAGSTTRTALSAPAPLIQDLNEDEDDDW
ncbi:PPE family protein [Mycobacterium sp. NPDC050041]|uniref:PPE family protein n=1 Tax=Mycobacterium sp. NPDC050041 TaxID=3364293 RepID=UPI003C2BF20E